MTRIVLRGQLSDGQRGFEVGELIGAAMRLHEADYPSAELYVMDDIRRSLVRPALADYEDFDKPAFIDGLRSAVRNLSGVEHV